MLRTFAKTALCLFLALASLGGRALADTGFEPESLETPEEIVTAAMEVYSWFAMCPLDVDMYAPNGEGTLYRVYDERLNTRAQLEAVVNEYFDADISASLLGSGVYTEENGYLYTGMDFREIDPTIASVEYAVSEETADKIWYTATVFYSEEEGQITSVDEYTFLREKIDGRWLFTDFWFFW